MNVSRSTKLVVNVYFLTPTRHDPMLRVVTVRALWSSFHPDPAQQ